jgi:hypothetical protein
MDCVQLKTSDAWNDPGKTTFIPGHEERACSCTARCAEYFVEGGPGGKVKTVTSLPSGGLPFLLEV